MECIETLIMNDDIPEPSVEIEFEVRIDHPKGPRVYFNEKLSGVLGWINFQRNTEGKYHNHNFLVMLITKKPYYSNIVKK